MTVQLISIAKKERSIYDPVASELIKMTRRFARIEMVDLFDKQIAKAQSLDADAASRAYTESLSPYLNRSYDIAMHPAGKAVDSYEFSKLLADKISVTFYIGGAYGFEPRFLERCDRVISLSPLTMSHKIAKVVLLEQIYRGFTLLNNHPYHK